MGLFSVDVIVGTGAVLFEVMEKALEAVFSFPAASVARTLSAAALPRAKKKPLAGISYRSACGEQLCRQGSRKGRRWLLGGCLLVLGGGGAA